MASITVDNKALITYIRQQTARANRNNLTRTKAYLHFFRKHEEIHWALLAHLVSRNGGWNMTDLKGEWLPQLLDQQAIEPFFWLLERSNWLIFHDAYPQLLLYEEMKRTRSDLTSLLAPLGVSSFMRPFWQEFLTTQNSERLTRALIINEQQYIEQRVVQKPFTYRRIFSTFAFFAQSVLSLNQVLFPYKAYPTDKQLSLAGLNVEHFPDVSQRIAVGKTLYQLLFADNARLKKFQQYAYRIPHTGSRADYWPHVFTSSGQASREAFYHIRLNGKHLQEGKPKIYSPTLQAAWPDVEHAAADGVDWFRDEGWVEKVDEPADLPTIDSDDYARSLQWIEYGVKWVSAFTGKGDATP